MRQVFSRWPTLAGAPPDGATANALPAWMADRPAARWRHVPRDLAVSLLVVGAPAAFTALAFVAANAAAASLSAVAAVASGLAALWCVMWLCRGQRQARQQFDAIFERAGISMWREDWTAAGEAVMALRRAGISDMESHFASRPDALRALKARVMVRDVNAFTVEETGAPGKDAYIGPLDRLLPETDQTFVQWLVAFARGDRFFRSEAHIVTAEGVAIDTLFTAMLPRDLAGFADIVVTSVDITAYKRAQGHLTAAEADVARTSRLSTANALSASIAHEVNSPLAAILANAQAAQRLLRPPRPDIAEAEAALGDVVLQATRAKAVVARTASYFSKAERAFERVDLVDAARKANLLVEADLRRYGAVTHLAAAHDLAPVLADPVQIQQVFVNLMLNAAQAMAGQPEGRDIMLVLSQGPSAVRVDVTDRGPGVAPERRAEIFEPFNSGRQGGMGMGLAICRSCLDAHGGDIWVDDAPGGGAAFHFTLPNAHD